MTSLEKAKHILRSSYISFLRATGLRMQVRPVEVSGLPQIREHCSKQGIQIAPEEVQLCLGVLGGRRLLVFGLGRDSRFWRACNGPDTLFLEDSPRWTMRVLSRNPCLEVVNVEYGTSMHDAEEMLELEDELMRGIPEGLKHSEWDAALVDGPKGFGDGPGRMKSIFWASRLVVPGGHVLVHDCDRWVERTYADRYLGGDNLISEVGRMRLYKL